jgi:membrane protein DedA with SNARE-associated domain
VTDIFIPYVEYFVALAPVWGFLLVFLFMAVESSFIPFPSEVVMIPAGILAVRGELTLGSPIGDAAVAVVAGIAGSLAGAFINYYLSAKLGRPFLYAYGKYVLLKPAHIERAEEIFNRYGSGATFVCRLLPAIRQLISIPAGVSQMPIGSFALWTGLGAGIWVIILTTAGYGIGSATVGMPWPDVIHQAEHHAKANMPLLAAVLVVGFVGYVVIKNRVMKSKGADRASTNG